MLLLLLNVGLQRGQLSPLNLRQTKSLHNHRVCSSTERTERLVRYDTRAYEEVNEEDSCCYDQGERRAHGVRVIGAREWRFLKVEHTHGAIGAERGKEGGGDQEDKVRYGLGVEWTRPSTPSRMTCIIRTGSSEKSQN